MNGKLNRLETIKELIESYRIANQEELLQLLAEKGFQLTQATLSRDLRKLHVTKSPDENGVYHYTIHKRPISPVPIQYQVKDRTQKEGNSIEFSGQVAIIKTRPGYASAIAGDIDAHPTHQIMGTIAGDDTILLILREGFEQKEVTEVLSSFIPNLFRVNFNK